MIQAQGVIAEARREGPLPTPVDGFRLDLEALDRLAERLREQAEDDGWANAAPTSDET